MAINSFSYFIFVTILLIILTAVQSNNERKKTCLLIASYYFYMTIDWRFAGLLVLLTVINFIAGKLLHQSSRQQAKKLVLSIAITISLATLFYFKYFNFFIDAFYQFLNTVFGLQGNSLVVEVVLPIGISFMTFQSITYTLDLYKGTLKQPCKLKDFSLFMAFFPQLLSGPIIRASYFLPQLAQSQKVSKQALFEGSFWILRGLIKKILIADILALHIVDPVFSNPQAYSTSFLIFALFAYSFQVYMDLGGYTDIAIGVGKMLGYKIPVNFNRPYLATSIANFWQRWHITMSSFFRDYLYEAIKHNRWRNDYLNLIIVFIAIGIWHGAGWNFVLYGLIHGTLVSIEHFKAKRRQQQGLKMVTYRGIFYILRVLQIFTIVTFTRLLFRGDDLTVCIEYLTAIFSATTGNFPLSWLGALAFISACLLHITPLAWRDQLTEYVAKLGTTKYAVIIAITIYIFTALSSGGVGFIYFNF